MSQDNYREAPPHERRDHIARARREMEAALILEEAPFKGETKEDSEGFDDYVLAWLERNTVAFRKAFDELWSESVDVVAEWRANREKILEEVRSRMKKLTGK